MTDHDRYPLLTDAGYRTVALRTRTVFREAIALYESEGYARVDGAGQELETGDLVYARPL